MLGGFLSQGKFLDIPGALSSSEAVNFIVGLGRSGKVFGVRSICEICHTPYNHSHSCKYYCQLCLLREQALNTATRRCPSCTLLHGPGQPRQFGCDFMWKSSSKGEAGSPVCAMNRPVTQASSSTPCLGSKPHKQGRALLSRWDVQETTHSPNCIFAMERVPDAPWDEGVQRKIEGEWELQGTRGLQSAA